MWTMPLLAGAQWLLVVVLLVGGALSAIVAPMRHELSAAQGRSIAVTRHLRGQSAAATTTSRTLGMRARALLPQPRQGDPVARQPRASTGASFAASFQMRSDSQATGPAGSTARTSAPAGPVALGGAGQGTRAKAGAPTRSGTGGTPSGAQGAQQGSGAPGTGGQAQTGQGASQQQQGTGTQQGLGSGSSDGQSPSLGAPEPSTNAATTGSAGQGQRPGQSQTAQQPPAGEQPSAGQQSQANSGNPSAGGTVSGGANPFGKDSTQAQNEPGSSAAAGTSGQRSATGPAQHAGASGKAPTGAHSPQNGTSAQPGDPDQQFARRRGTNEPVDPGQAQAAAKQAGRATGPQIDLGGQSQLGGDGTGAQVVRIEPLSAGPAPAQAGTSGQGAAVVQGYVPQDDSTMSAADQSLIRAYFSQGSGS
jgi:hypothetical protein